MDGAGTGPDGSVAALPHPCPGGTTSHPGKVGSCDVLALGRRRTAPASPAGSGPGDGGRSPDRRLVTLPHPAHRIGVAP